MLTVVRQRNQVSGTVYYLVPVNFYFLLQFFYVCIQGELNQKKTNYGKLGG